MGLNLLGIHEWKYLAVSTINTIPLALDPCHQLSPSQLPAHCHWDLILFYSQYQYFIFFIH
ncbi:GSCOCG00013151001-RA-CDS [Cotesia congregata]|nr:GSCOCG00013151001-RA-CDS [Cotesia congregata]